jgi:chromate transporter
MIRKTGKDTVRIIILVLSCSAMLLADIFSWRISTIVLLLAAALISMAVFLLQGSRTGKGGEAS